METIKGLNQEQLVTLPTHVKGNILDMIATSSPQDIEDLVVTNSEDLVGKRISDHYLV